MHAQPLICVADVRASGAFYAELLGADKAHGDAGHGGHDYERVMIGDRLLLQLHGTEVEHHHGAMATPGVPLGNGVAVWFGTEDLDAAVARAKTLGAEVVTDIHRNPNSGARELWLRDLDGYLVVLAEWPSGGV